MKKVYVSLGSNIDAEKNLNRALQNLKNRYGKVILSPVYESLAVGFSGDNFLNMVVAYETQESVQQVVLSLKEIEQQQGRRAESKGFNPRNIDLDLLLYDDAIIQEDGLDLPRSEIHQYAFVLRPLADIYPQGKDPLSGKTYADLWQAFSDQDQELWPKSVEFEI